MCSQYPALYINLARATDRQQAFEAQADFAACGMHRLEAVDGQTLLKVAGAKLKRGQQGCIQSHMHAWEKARYSAATSPYTVVFEDDFQLGNYASRIPQILAEAEHACNGQPADVVWLNRTIVEGEPSTEHKLTPQLHDAALPFYGMHAYAISKAGAAKLLHKHERDQEHLFQEPLDVYFHRYLADSDLCMAAVEPQVGHVPVSSTSTTEEA